MKLKWSKEEIKYFNKKIPKAEEVNDWAWWGLFGTIVIMVIIVVLKILGKI